MQPTPPKPPKAAPDPTPTAESLENQDPQETTATTLDTSPQDYYQAIGWLRGKIIKEEERYCVQIRDINFPLYLPRRVIAVAANLEGQMAWLKCYPQSKGEGLSFKVVWMGTEQNEKSDAGIFVLRGVWQFIPQSRRPVFSIYRNELKNYENRPNNQHLPLIWSDQPPYRFRKDSDERPKFYQIMARLIPQRHCFGFVSQIADPQAQTPKRVKKTAPGPGNQGERKPTREDKQDAPPLPNRKKITSVNNANDAAEIKSPPLQGSPGQTATDKVDTQARETPVATIKVQEAQTKLLTERVAPPEDPQPVDTVMDKPPAQVPHAPVLSQEKNQSAKTKALKESKSPKTEGNSSSR